MDFTKLQDFIEMRCAENQKFSLPFVVKSKNGEKFISWFWYQLSGDKKSGLFAHIYKVYILNENYELQENKVILDIPSELPQKPETRLREYLVQLESVYNDFSEEEMSKLIQDSFKPLYNAYQCARSYVHTQINKESA